MKPFTCYGSIAGIMLLRIKTALSFPFTSLHQIWTLSCNNDAIFAKLHVLDGRMYDREWLVHQMLHIYPMCGVFYLLSIDTETRGCQFLKLNDIQQGWCSWQSTSELFPEMIFVLSYTLDQGWRSRGPASSSRPNYNGLGLGLGYPWLGLGLGGPGFLYRVSRTGLSL